MKRPKPVMMMILDGWGIEPDGPYNAITKADPVNFDRLWNEYPSTVIKASGEDVGLPDGQMGNSEVGHLNIGSGRIIYQDYTRVSKSIRDGDFFENEEFLNAVKHCKKHDSSLHLMGLFSDGGVHSHLTHLFAFLKLAKKHDLKKVYIHAFLDGRDVPPKSAIDYFDQLDEEIKNTGTGQVSTVMGRFYAMDRDKRWERVEEAYQTLTGDNSECYKTPQTGVDARYSDGQIDELMKPFVVGDKHKEQFVNTNDSIIFYNFRPDRAREITRSFVDDDFSNFARKDITNLYYVCLTSYDITIKAPVAYKPVHTNEIFGEILSENGLKQLRIAETEKYAHVTFFYNGGVEKAFPLEERILIDSPKVKTYDMKPEMSAIEVKDRVIKEIREENFDVIILNFANPDMVGHTGVFDAAVKAIKTVDGCVGEIVAEIMKKGGEVLITADHGNAEKMFDEETNQPFTQHTINPVPVILVSERFKDKKLSDDGRLADLAPTILELLDIKKPEEMSGRSLLIK